MKINPFVKVISALVLSLCMLISGVPVSAVADEVPMGGILIKDDNGNVVEEGYILYISSSDDLIQLAEYCRVNTWSTDMYIVLQNDIDMTGVDFAGIPTFGGTFIGSGHTIKGLNITATGSVVGFFRYLQDTAVVEDLTLEGTIQPGGSKSTVGGFAGSNAGKIYNCAFNGTVTGYEEIGGFVGINEVSALIENCTVSGSVYGSHFVGGIAGENQGVIRQCENTAEINTKAVHNSVDIEDITIDNLINTESADTATDIGGIAGISSGIIRECINRGAVGYQSMGYNVGGIAGSQNGYLVDCVNYANIQGRKEVGGIVGHMEPNIVLEFSEDSIQHLSEQMQELSAVLNDLRTSLDKSGKEIGTQMDKLEKDIDVIQKSIDIIREELEKLENNSEAETDEEMLNRISSVDLERISTAVGDLSSALKDAVTRISNIQEQVSELSDNAGAKIEEAVEKIDEIVVAIEHMEDNLDFSVTDISDQDTEADTLGKVQSCINYGEIYGERNVGGIAGVLAEETDLDQYYDVEIAGEASLNGKYNLRVVVRDCNNFGAVNATKQYAGGIVGQMVLGAVIDCVNMGNLDAISTDYVGGIAGKSYAVIRGCSSKCVIAGDTYVGGIVGEGNEVTDCYAFVSIEAYTEKAGAITGSLGDVIERNYYYITDEIIGGIDGITYTGVAENLDLDDFLQLPNLNELLKTVTVRFVSKGQEVGSYTLKVGDSLTMKDVPTVEVDDNTEYTWKMIQKVTSTTLGMGESAEVSYISEDCLTNILFDQTFETEFDLKATVIQGTDKGDKDLPVILANGIFSKDTNIQISDLDKENINGKEVVDGKQVELSNEGVTKLHYLIPSNVKADYVKLYVKNESGEWVQRDYVVDGSYFVFEFTDGESAFGFVEDYSSIISMVYLVASVIIILIVVAVVIFVRKKIRKKKSK